jgi:hypothetical protein
MRVDPARIPGIKLGEAVVMRNIQAWAQRIFSNVWRSRGGRVCDDPQISVPNCSGSRLQHRSSAPESAIQLETTLGLNVLRMIGRSLLVTLCYQGWRSTGKDLMAYYSPDLSPYQKLARNCLQHVTVAFGSCSTRAASAG